jgi:uncharacterized membrane protein
MRDYAEIPDLLHVTKTLIFRCAKVRRLSESESPLFNGYLSHTKTHCMEQSATIQANPLRKRIESIDLLRGWVMIIMAIDHVRDYFHEAAFQYDPTDLSQTTPELFLTRFITHFCAPVFMFLSGTSAFLVGERKGKKALSKFLLTRGLWLVILELTIISFGWYFNFFKGIDLVVIWALGMSMIFLAAIIWLPLPAIIVIGLAMVFGHNLLDPIRVPGQGVDALLWSIVHQANFFDYKLPLFVGYPLVPWIGVMALGYATGYLYNRNYEVPKRKRQLLMLGIASVILFMVIRFINEYGDPIPWTEQKNGLFTFLSFINVFKYPPSLLYVLVTLGPALVFLALSENARGWLIEKVKVIGRVPMFFYIVHLYLIHLAAMIATWFDDKQPTDMILDTFVIFDPKLQGYGFSLGITYAVWFVLIVILYFLCRWYDRYKRTHTHWWLSYL